MIPKHNDKSVNTESDEARIKTSGFGEIDHKLLNKSHVKIKMKNKTIILGACHKIPSRSFIWRGKPLLCYRCLGIYGSFLLSALIYITYRILILFNPSILPILDLKAHWDYISYNSFLLKILYVILLHLPYILDGVIQARSKSYTSNNLVRFITGVLGGIGQFYFFLTLGQLTKYLFQLF